MDEGTPKVAVIGNYLPRQCGIATFTMDMCQALSAVMKEKANPIAVAMDDRPQGYDYPFRVRFQIDANVQADYLSAAEYLNSNQYDIVILQHEYGIFGGEYGAYILDMVHSLRMPVICTLHTVLEKPKPKPKFILQELAKSSDRLVVMSHTAEHFLEKVYGVPRDKIRCIPHGIPDVPLPQPGRYNDTLGVPGRMLLTFGLLSQGKGLEYMIKAMPAILEQFPEMTYVILGETHPHVKELDGDAYRNSLVQLTHTLGVTEHVLFHNRFVSQEALCQYLQSAEVYVTPYLSREQIVSGTLAYAFGCCGVVVSSPYNHAEELLADGRGVLVPFRDHQALAEAVLQLLSDNEKRNRMRTLAYQLGRSMIWREVAHQYRELAMEVIGSWRRKPSCRIRETHINRLFNELPEIRLDHLRVLTDDTGVLQHAIFSVPNLHHGYCNDDNARALIATCLYHTIFRDKSVLPLLKRYLAFLYYSFNPDNGYFRNFMSFTRQWLELKGSEDAHGRTMMALGIAVENAPGDPVRGMAMRLFQEGMGVIENFTSPRAWAFIIIGLHAYLAIYSGDAAARKLRTTLAERLYNLFQANASPEWYWLEETVTYANAKLCQALILAGQWIPHTEMFQCGLTALEWLLEKQTAREGHLSIIGNDAWMSRDGTRSAFDQQPIEAMGLVEACAEAYRATGNQDWFTRAETCLGWFLGRNDLTTPLYNFETGGCCDGLHPMGVNANQGAESTLAGLISILVMYEISGSRALIDQGLEKETGLETSES